MFLFFSQARIEPVQLIDLFDQKIKQIEYLIHGMDKPTEWIEYEAVGPFIHDSIGKQVNMQEKIWHDSHQCRNCHKCHKCKECGACIDCIPCEQDGLCINCEKKYMSIVHIPRQRFDKQRLIEWRHSLRIFIYNKELLCVGGKKYIGVFDESQHTRIKRLADDICVQDYKDNTKDNSDGRQKYFFRAKYAFTQKEGKNYGFKKWFGVNTNVQPLPIGFYSTLVVPLENVGILKANETNHGAFNNYLDQSAIDSHHDGQTTFDKDSDVCSVTVENGKSLRFNAGVRNKNPLFYLDLMAPQVFTMCNHTFVHYLKHCFTSKDKKDETSTFILRRVYPFLMLMSAQHARSAK